MVELPTLLANTKVRTLTVVDPKTHREFTLRRGQGPHARFKIDLTLGEELAGPTQIVLGRRAWTAPQLLGNREPVRLPTWAPGTLLLRHR